MKYYDILVEKGELVCPIAHTYLTVHIGVLINLKGEFLCAKIPDIKGEIICAPCTISSETRTSNIAPHLLHDNICYVADFGAKYTEHHKEYKHQLKYYVEQCPYDIYAGAVYKYIAKDTLMEDIKDILPKKTEIPLEKMNIVFCVYELKTEGRDDDWTKYYLSQLQPNGICHLTGKQEYIPSAYPKCITSKSGKEVLFGKESHVGYIASQKIIHTLQYLSYGRKNKERVEIEEKLQGLFKGELNMEELKEWTDENYPGRWKKLLGILRGIDKK